MDSKDLRALMEAYQQISAPIDEAQKPFPFKKVEAQKEKARKVSVYGKDTGNAPVPQVSDAEKKATTRFSKMQQTYEKAKRAKQEADKSRRSSTFYKDTHPASSPKMRKANEEFDIFDAVLEFLQSEGIAETIEEAQWMMANLLNKNEIDIIAEAMHEKEEEEDEKEMKKGKKSKKEKEEEDEDEEEEDIKEATYSAKSARAGKDIGKPGKAFAKIAKSAAKRYGSKERGEKVAGAVLAKLRAKRG